MADGFLRVTYALACRWTDTQELAREVVLHNIVGGVLRGSSVYYAKECQGGPWVTTSSITVV